MLSIYSIGGINLVISLNPEQLFNLRYWHALLQCPVNLHRSHSGKNADLNDLRLKQLERQVSLLCSMS